MTNAEEDVKWMEKAVVREKWILITAEAVQRFIY